MPGRAETVPSVCVQGPGLSQNTVTFLLLRRKELSYSAYFCPQLHSLNLLPAIQQKRTLGRNGNALLRAKLEEFSYQTQSSGYSSLKCTKIPVKMVQQRVTIGPMWMISNHDQCFFFQLYEQQRMHGRG